MLTVLSISFAFDKRTVSDKLLSGKRMDLYHD